jgi:hypothetical protein
VPLAQGRLASSITPDMKQLARQDNLNYLIPVDVPNAGLFDMGELCRAESRYNRQDQYSKLKPKEERLLKRLPEDPRISWSQWKIEKKVFA